MGLFPGNGNVQRKQISKGANLRHEGDCNSLASLPGTYGWRGCAVENMKRHADRWSAARTSAQEVFVSRSRLRILVVQLGVALAVPGSLLAAGIPAPSGPARLAHFDFGVITLGREVRHEFQVVNTSTVPISVKSVAASCECLQVTSVSSNIPAGTVGKLAIVLRPQTAGFVDYSVAFETVPEEGTKLFTLSGKAVACEAGSLRTNLLVSARELLARQAGGEALCLLDVRSQDGYRLARIPGSLNLSLFTVKTKGFLRPKRVILVNEGCGHDDLLAECDKLAAAGFVAPCVLDGGVRAWQQAGGPLEGEDVASSRVGAITPAQFYFGHADDLWLVAGVGDSAEVTGASLGLAATPVPADGAEFMAGLTAALQRDPAARRLLVVSRDGQDYGQLEKALHGFPGPPVFYLAGGAKAYSDFLSQQFAMQNRRTMTIASGTGPQFARNARASGGSGGCCGGKK